MGEDIDVDHTCLPPESILFMERDFFFVVVVGTIPWECIGKALFCWEFSSYWMIFYHSIFRMRNSKNSKMKEKISQMIWCGLVILGTANHLTLSCKNEM